MLTYPKLTVRTISNNFNVRSRISQKRIKTSTIGKKKELVDRHLLPVGEKIDELWFTNKKVIDADVDPPKFKIRRDFGQLETLSANILERIDIPKIDSKLDRLPSLPR